MNSKLRPWAVLLVGAFLMAMNGAWMIALNRLFHMPFKEAIMGYVVITPLLLIGLFAGLARLNPRRTGKSRMQKVIFVSFFPASAVVVVAGFYAGHQLATCVIWYIGMLAVFTYYFLGFKGQQPEPREPK